MQARVLRAFNQPRTLLGRWRNVCTVNKAAPRPFKDIPKTPSLPLIGSTWQFLSPRVWNRPLYQLQFERMQKYGVIYRDKIPVLSDYVVVHRPEDIEEIFRKGEGRYPSRVSFPPWVEVREELGIGRGILLL